MSSYEILKQEWFSIRNQDGAIRSKKEESKFLRMKDEKLEEINNQLSQTEVNNLLEEVEEMLRPKRR